MSTSPPPSTQPPTLPRSSRGRATRERLLSAARGVFEQHGFVETRVGLITAAAGTAYGSFYTHFPSKEAIFYEVADRLFEEMFLAADDDTATTPQDRLAQANRTYATRYRANSALMAIIEQVSTIDPDFRAIRMAHRRRTTERTAASIRRWQDKGLVSADLDPIVTAEALGAMVDRTLYLRNVLGGIDTDADGTVATLNLLCTQALGLPTPQI